MRTVIALLLLICLHLSCTRDTTYRQPASNGAHVEIALTEFRDGIPEFYAVTINGKEVRFFIIVNKGIVEAYLDACIECYPKRLGYRYDEGMVICRKCNVSYPLEALKTGIGKCYPIVLKGTQVEGKYLIEHAALAEGLKYFR